MTFSSLCYLSVHFFPSKPFYPLNLLLSSFEEKTTFLCTVWQLHIYILYLFVPWWVNNSNPACFSKCRWNKMSWSSFSEVSSDIFGIFVHFGGLARNHGLTHPHTSHMQSLIHDPEACGHVRCWACNLHTQLWLGRYLPVLAATIPVQNEVVNFQRDVFSCIIFI